MKKNILLLVSAIVFSSCDGFLETKSNSVFTEETSFANIDFAQKVVNGAYDNLASVYLFGSYFLWYNCDNDIEFVIAADNNGTYNLAHYSGNEGISALNNWWNLYYSSIERANICIDNLPVSSVWEGEYAAEARRIYGEAITLRALCYSELIKIFGDVPFKTKSTQAGDDYFLPKTDRDIIYEHLVQDLKEVEDYLPWLDDIGTTERINRGFAKGLRARIALAYAGYSLRNKTYETRRGRYWEDYYKIANQECREIIESNKHTLNPDFESIFRSLHAYSQDLTYKEVLFEVAFGRLNTGRLGYDIGMYFAYTVPSPKYGRGNGTVRTSPYYYYSFDRADIRRDVSVALYKYGTTGYLDVQYPISSNGTEFRPSKWRKSWIIPAMGGDLQTAQFTGVNYPLMRYSDILLMYAETENEINGVPTPAAKEAFSLVRQRAFPEEVQLLGVKHYVDSVSISKESFFNAIVDERAWEFGGEMIRKGDLVRWNLLGTKIKKMKEESHKIIYGDPAYADLVPNYIFWKTASDGETIEILNPDYSLPSNNIPGYTRMAWLPLMSAGSKTSFTTNFDRIAHGYNETKNNHLHPISINTITASNGSLENDQIP